MAPPAQRHAARLAHPIVHGGAGNGGDPRRPCAGRRSRHAVVHVRVDGERGRSSARRARLRRHPPGYAEHRRGRDRGGDHAPHEGDLRRPLRRGMRGDGQDPSHRSAPWPSCDRGCRSRHPVDLSRQRRRERSAICPASASTKPRMRRRARAGPSSSAAKNSPNRAYVIWEKGTNRRDLKLGLVDKYTGWMSARHSSRAR